MVSLLHLIHSNLSCKINSSDLLSKENLGIASDASFPRHIRKKRPRAESIAKGELIFQQLQ